MRHLTQNRPHPPKPASARAVRDRDLTRGLHRRPASVIVASHDTPPPLAGLARPERAPDLPSHGFGLDFSLLRLHPSAAGIQMKRTLPAPGDAFEQEAERIAGQVTGMSVRGPRADPATGPPTGTPTTPAPEPPLSTRVLHAGSPSAALPPHVLAASQGRPLSPAARGFMEPRFGRPFGHVRVHSDEPAAQSADALAAHAYTVGPHIMFGARQYSPDTRSGRHLLAHELVHVLQQQYAAPRVQRTLNDGHDLNSNRFKGNIELESAYDDETVIENGDTGLQVTILQQALVDAGLALPIHGVDGRFGDETEQAVKDFQTSKGLTGRDVDGEVGPITMNLFDQHFLHHVPERAIAAHPTRPLMEGTRALSAAEQSAVTRAVTTEVRTPTGALPTFSRTIVSHPDPYEVRIRNRLNTAITNLYTNLVASRPARTAANMMSAADVDRLSQRAKAVTDAVYGRYRTGPALAFGVNIFDQFLQRQAQIAASTTNADWAANWRVLKLLNGDRGIAQIDEEHGAVQTRATEWSLIAGVTGFPNTPPGVLDYNASPPNVTTGIVGTRRAELLDIHRNWPASAGGGRIYLQMYLGSTNAANRDIMYETFATIIHEYIHTLEHPNHVTYRESLAEQRGGFVLREGMTDYLAKVVWDNLSFDPPLRAAIEDRFQDPLNPNGHPIPAPPRYREWANAERAVGIVGIRNAMAAFFLGHTNLMGGP